LDSLPFYPIVTQNVYKFTDFIDGIKKNPPTRIPNPFNALDIFLILTERIQFLRRSL